MVEVEVVGGAMVGRADRQYGLPFLDMATDGWMYLKDREEESTFVLQLRHLCCQPTGFQLKVALLGKRASALSV